MQEYNRALKRNYKRTCCAEERLSDKQSEKVIEPQVYGEWRDRVLEYMRLWNGKEVSDERFWWLFGSRIEIFTNTLPNCFLERIIKCTVVTLPSIDSRYIFICFNKMTAGLYNCGHFLLTNNAVIIQVQLGILKYGILRVPTLRLPFRSLRFCRQARAVLCWVLRAVLLWMIPFFLRPFDHPLLDPL